MMPFLFFGAYLTCAVALGVWILRVRDKSAKRAGKTEIQTRARFDSLLQLKTTVYYAAPGLLVISFGAFYAVVGYSDADKDWWQGLIAIVIGWALVPLLARKSWKRYLALRRVGDGEPDDATDPSSPTHITKPI